MSMFPSTARGSMSALAGLRSQAPMASMMLRRSFTPLAASTSAKVQQQPTTPQAKPLAHPTTKSMFKQPVSPAAMATQMVVRPFVHSSKVMASTTSYSQGEALKLLNEQRSLRPNSPHLTIYQPQVTWYLSIFTRMTGVGLSVLFYGWAITYLALPYTSAGQVFSGAHLVQYAAQMPFWLKMAIKAPVAFGLSFHTFNGIRHLAWDYGYGLSMKGVYTGAYIVLGASVAATAYLLTL